MLTLEQIDALFQSRRAGHSLPQALYNDPAAFAFDMDAIFARSWLLAGFEAELQGPGGYMAFTFGGWPILILRDRAGQLRAFHNTCRHRGAQLCPDGSGSASRLVCPYHSWTYELTGRLLRAPRMGDGFDPDEHALGPIHVESVCGVIYVCLAEEPPPIAGFRDKFEPLIAPHRLRDAKLAFESTLVEKGNWKLVMENARECYHCQRQHPELSASFPVGVGGYFDFGEDAHAREYAARMAALGIPTGPVRGEWWEATRFALNPGHASMTTDGRPASARLMCETGGGDIGSLRWAVEPHGFCHATADHLFMFTALPVGPNETIVRSKWLVHKDALEGVDYDVERLASLWTTTNLQDRALVENNQRGVNSPGYRPGPYSAEAESLVIDFVDWYCARARAYLAGPAT